MGTIKLDAIVGLSTDNDVTIASNKFVGTASGNMTVVGEGGTTQTNLQQGLLKVWHNFDGESTVATRDSFNTSGLTDNGTGDYSLTITNDFANVNYVANCDNESGNGDVARIYGEGSANGRYETGIFRIYVFQTDDRSATDSNIVTAMLAGDLA